MYVQMTGYILVAKYDAIKQNESELENSSNSVSCSLYASTSELYHTENSIKIKPTVPAI